MDTLRRDLTYAVRGLRNILGFAAVATLTIALGIGACTAIFAITQVMVTLLVGVNPTDPVTFAAIVALFGMIAVTASWIPARQASRLDPMAAIRAE
jgi:ABC-type antimicrobial peptide transport system permease subunit